MREPRRGPRTAWALWVGTIVLALPAAVLTVIAWTDLEPTDAWTTAVAPIGAIVYATLGSLIVRRVGNRLGWVLLAEGLGQSVQNLMTSYGVVGVLTHPGSLPAAKMVGALSEWIFVPIVSTLVFALLLFPTGTLPSRRWRPVATLGIAITGLAMIGFLITPRQVGLPAPGGVSLIYANPLAIRSFNNAVSTALIGTVPSLVGFSIVLFGAAMVVLVVRYRSGAPDLRQQIKWVAFAGVAALVSQAALGVAQAASGSDSLATSLTGIAAGFVALFGIPVAITIAILRYRLYDIDFIINRAVVYGLLAAAVTAVYALVVVGIGTLIGYGVGNPVLTTGAAVVIALLFQPARSQAQRVANRIVYGERATPYQVLSDFAENLAGTIGLDELLDRMVAVLADGTGASRVDVWLRVGSELRPAATWPRGSATPEALSLGRSLDLPPFPDAARAIAVRRDEELLGALTLQKPRNEGISPAEDKLLQHLASQAGLVLRNVALTAELRDTIDELRASRRRLVGAQDSERRKIERNLHDGAQQQLVALKVRLGLLDRVAANEEQVKQVATQLQEALQQALDDLRDLARGIYPPLLADRGLAVALEAQANKSAVLTNVESDGIGRYPEEIESAVYFCALEAMQNTAKYAGATSSVIRLAELDGHLVFEIEDDGRGFDVSEKGHGTGIQGMSDRLDAIGGTLEVTSEPTRGTLVRGTITLPRRPQGIVDA